MSEENEETLDRIYAELKGLRDEIGLKLHLGSMELRDQWKQLESEWETWTHQVAKDLQATGDDVEERLREAGGEDLRKVEIKTRVAIGKLKRGFQEIVGKLGEK